jgi:DNA (cytosine-5)-methyltransferase 1
MAPRRGKAPTLISLFSGAGGLDIGLERVGFETRVMVEIDRDARATLELNRGRFRWPDFTVFEDATKVTPQELLEASGLRAGEATLVAGGPPCQSFSTAGRRQSIGDPRGSLFVPFAEAIAAIQPRFFVMENVRGLQSAAIKHRPLNQRGDDHATLSRDERPGSALRVILDTFESLGYQVVKGLVNAADYGVPQTRERLLIIGSRDDEFPRGAVEPRDLMTSTHARSEWRTLGDVLKELNGHKQTFIPYSQSRADIFKLIPEGKNWRHIRDEHGDEMLRDVMGGAYAADGGRVGFYRRLSRKKPAPTLPTSPIQKSTGLCHPTKLRPLSVEEYGAIQQFPPDWEFAGSVASRYKQIGNAVPTGLGEAIGDALVQLMKGNFPQQRRLLESRASYSRALAQTL